MHASRRRSLHRSIVVLAQIFHHLRRSASISIIYGLEDVDWEQAEHPDGCRSARLIINGIDCRFLIVIDIFFPRRTDSSSRTSSSSHSIIAINTILIIHHPSKHHILDDVYGTSRSTAVLYCSIDNISTTTVHYDRVDLQY
jgi:hypothetical protein